MKKIQKLKIKSNKNVAEDHFVLECESKFLARKTKPGQFVEVKVQSKGGTPLLKTPLGVHKIKKDTIALLYKIVGESTKVLSTRKKGETVEVLGPLGNGFDIDRTREAVLVSGGHGVAPLYALAEDLKKNKIKTTFINGARTKNQVLCRTEIKKLGAKFIPATEDGTLGVKGFVTKPLEKVLREKKDAVIYTCGPRPMLAAVAALGEKYKTKVQASLDAYMACGIGVCLGCAVLTKKGYKLVCKDGPVFSADEIRWDKEK